MLTVREGYAEALPLGSKLVARKPRRVDLPPPSPLIPTVDRDQRKYTTINYASSSAVSSKSYQYGKYSIETS